MASMITGALAQVRLLGFDLDGTLADTGDEIAAAANAALADSGLAARERDAIVRHVGHGGRELMRRLLAEAGGCTGDAEVAAAHTRFDACYGKVAGTLSRPYPGCVEALGRLAGAGVALACISNKNEAFSVRVLEACGIARYFSIVVGGDTLPVRKPDPRVVGYVLAALGGDERSMAFVGDSRTDVLTARAAGIAAWAVPWGYNGGEPIEKAGPDRVFASFAEIADAALGSH